MKNLPKTRFHRIKQAVLFCAVIGLAVLRSYAQQQGYNDSSRIYENGAEVVVDGSLHTTGAVRSDKFIEMVGLSTVTLPATGHAKMYVSSTTHQVCAEFDNATTSCFGTLTSFTATDPIHYNSGTGNFTLGAVSLSTGVTGSLNSSSGTISLFTTSTMTVSSVTITAATISTETVTFLTVSTVTIGQTRTNSCGYLIGTFPQVVQVTDDTQSTSSGTVYTPTATKASITPKCSTDKIKISVTGTIKNSAQTLNDSWATIFRGTTDLSNGNGFAANNATTAMANQTLPASFTYLDSPATISSTTYTVEIIADVSGQNTKWNVFPSRAVILLEELAN